MVLFFSKKYLEQFPHLDKHPHIQFSLCTKGTYPAGGLKILHEILKLTGKVVTLNRKNFSFLNLSRNKNRILFIRGWKERHAPSYMEEHKSTLKTLFEPKETVKDLVASVWPKEKETIVIGVHIRRGDYRTIQ